jgi:putative oxidoreductase
MHPGFSATYPLTRLVRTSFGGLNRIGEFLPQLGLRLLLAYEFWQAGLEKWNGMNWFGEIMVMFLPLLFSGPGKLSLDHLIARRLSV